MPSHQKIRKTPKEGGIKRANGDRSFYFVEVTEGYLWECVHFHSSALRCKNAKPADLRLHSIICSHAHVRGMLMEIANINTGLKKLCQAAVGERILSLSIFSPFISPFSLLANTCILIPAPSTPSAGGHRQTRSPPFFSSLLLTPFLNPLVSVMDHIWERLSRSRPVCRSTAREQIWILPGAGTFLSGGGRQTLLHNQCMFTGRARGGLNDHILLVTSLSSCVFNHIHDGSVDCNIDTAASEM